jgi:6-phosphogluconolactonase (cycloisomerase 2 family)
MSTSATGTNLQAYTIINGTGSLMGFSAFGNATTPGGFVIDPSGLTAFNPDSSSGLVYWYGYAGPGLWSTEYSSISPLIPATFTAAAGAGPVAMDPSGRYLFVANKTADSISEFQPSGAAPVPDFPLPASPLAICSNATGNYLFVATSDDKLRMLTPGSSGALTDSFGISLPAKPTAVAAEPSGHYVYVTSASGISAFAIDEQASTLTVVPLNLSIPLTNATGVYIDPSGQYLYVSTSNSTTGSLYLFTVNSDGTLTAAGGGPVATPRNTTGLVFHAQVQ